MLKKLIKNDRVRDVVEWILVFAAAYLLFFIVTTFFFRTASVSGNSMEPTLKHNEWVLLGRIGYRFGEPKPGDIVAFPFKDNPSEHFIKRVVAVPGDTVDLIDGFFYVNGELLKISYTGLPVTATGDVEFPVKLTDSYFVLGDNRDISKDSRYQSVGCIAKKDMVGKVVLRIWPFGAFGKVE
ncbi:MAG: signal peptidase I [Defluviitaleaceae bacterium]|nr:signal peptidase I [Defluviitaleaceae bacterium]